MKWLAFLTFLPALVSPSYKFLKCPTLRWTMGRTGDLMALQNLARNTPGLGFTCKVCKMFWLMIVENLQLATIQAVFISPLNCLVRTLSEKSCCDSHSSRRAWRICSHCFSRYQTKVPCDIPFDFLLERIRMFTTNSSSQNTPPDNNRSVATGTTTPG